MSDADFGYDLGLYAARVKFAADLDEKKKKKESGMDPKMMAILAALGGGGLAAGGLAGAHYGLEGGIGSLPGHVKKLLGYGGGAPPPPVEPVSPYLPTGSRMPPGEPELSDGPPPLGTPEVKTPRVPTGAPIPGG